MARPGPWLAIALLALVALPTAGAHAVLLSSEPEKGTRLDEAPAFVSVTLTEPADPDGTTLRVLRAPGGERVDLGDLTSSGGDRPTLRVSLPQGLPDGAYTIAWQALSVTDGHTTRGTVGFAVGDFTPPDSQGNAPQPVPVLGASGRFLALLGLALGLGAALFLLWIPGAVPVPRRPALEALLLGAGLHLLGVVLLLKATLDQTGLSTPDLAQTSIGRTLLLRVGLGVGALAFAAIASSPRVPARLPPHIAVLLLVASGLGSARFGHASSLGLTGILVDAMHLVAAAAWAGGLLVFLWMLADAARRPWTGNAVRLVGVRFGTAALVSVILLLTAGVGATLAILGPAAWRDPGDAFATAWGKALAAKVAVTLAMLALAAVNRYGVLEPSPAAGPSRALQHLVTRWAPGLRVLDGGAPSMRRLLAVEAAFGAITLALAAILTSVSPPVDAAAAGPSLEVTGAGTDFHGALTVDPAPVLGGTSGLRLHLESHLGIPVEGNSCGRGPPASCVSAVIGTQESGETRWLQPLGGGDWGVDGVLWTTAGDTTVTIHVSTSEVPDDRLAFAVPVRANA